MRTKGWIHKVLEYIKMPSLAEQTIANICARGTINPITKDGKIIAYCNEGDEHPADCLRAIADIGGDPDTVGKAFSTLKLIRDVATKGERGMPVDSYKDLEWIAKASKALLAKLGEDKK